LKKEERERLRAEEDANDSDNSETMRDQSIDLNKRLTFKDVMDEIDKIERNY